MEQLLEQLPEFAANHTVLVAGFFAVLSALVWNLVTDPGGKNAVDAVAATAMINHEDAVVVDVRSMAEFKDGHIVNAVNIPINGTFMTTRNTLAMKSEAIRPHTTSG